MGFFIAEVVKNKNLFTNFWLGIKNGIFDILIITSNFKKAWRSMKRNRKRPICKGNNLLSF